MATATFRRKVTRVHKPPIHEASPGHRLRELIPHGQFEEHDPFLLLNEDWFNPGTFGDHPHRGFETVTYVLDGVVAHSDNRGNSGRLDPGDAQWMTAGRGIIHSEEAEGTAHTLQLWINLPSSRKMVEPRYQDLRGREVPVRREPGAILRVFAGRSGDVVGRAENQTPITMVVAELDPGASVSQELPADHQAFAYVVSGRGLLGPEKTPAEAGHIVWFSRGEDRGESEITIMAGDQPLKTILWAGRPLREPVAAYGPFVMNTPDQIRQAIADFQAGRF